MTWTPERENKLRTLWMQGLSASQIAAQLGGVTRNAVIGKRVRLGLPDRAMPNRSYGKQNQRKRKEIVQAAVVAKPPKLKAEPAPKPRAPKKGPNSVRFIDRAPSQCPMFCAGEEGPEGFVCGEPNGPDASWCQSCRRIVFVPAQARKVA